MEFIIIYLRREGKCEDSYIAVANCDNKLEAENVVNKHPDAIVVYGTRCQIVPKHTEIIIPT